MDIKKLKTYLSEVRAYAYQCKEIEIANDIQKTINKIDLKIKNIKKSARRERTKFEEWESIKKKHEENSRFSDIESAKRSLDVIDQFEEELKNREI